MEVARDQIQEATPWSTEGSDGLQRDAFDIHGIAPWLLPGAPDKNLANSALKPRPGRFEFFRVPYRWTGLPVGIVPNPERDSPDKCVNYATATLDESRIAWIRQPQLPLYAEPDTSRNGKTPRASTLAPSTFRFWARSDRTTCPAIRTPSPVATRRPCADPYGGANVLVWPTMLALRRPRRSVVKHPEQSLSAFTNSARVFSKPHTRR